MSIAIEFAIFCLILFLVHLTSIGIAKIIHATKEATLLKKKANNIRLWRWDEWWDKFIASIKEELPREQT